MAKSLGIEKAQIMAALRELLREQLAVISRSAQEAHDAATHEDAKPENEYDTRGLERFGAGDAIRATALVELSSESGDQLCLVLPSAGGIKVQIGKHAITVLTPQSPLGQAIIGKTQGDMVEVTTLGAHHEYEITRVV
jgi:hypothetical protein